ncbi:MAG: heme-binding protein [Roseibium sp.]|uniref:GlcG/HbpS family heme-binding protein n=1 Tax=Roseibium sp. TaxID=1936156 RepID=UPI001B1F85D9|nr:heme-binding protein [Roseibium sp.]MBO6893769.1 heme-binding protein [Roseibium sp.]MBO6928590.1 heme-binding protein [Roseibium sp.]
MRLQVSLPLQTAAIIVDEALRLGRQEELLPLTVVVLDAGGKIVAVKCEDGSGIMRFDVAFGKAWGALGMGISSRLIRDRLSARPTFQAALATASDGRLIPVPGGVLVRDKDNITIGAVGISGDTSDKDEYCAIEAIKIAGYQSEPAEPAEDWRSSSLSDHYPD